MTGFCWCYSGKRWLRNQQVVMLAWFALAIQLLSLVAVQANADDWPTYRRDQRRSGITNEDVDAARLKPTWVWTSPLPPAPAWPDSARWDAYASLEGLRSMRNYDPVFHPVVVGGRVFLPSNSDDTLRCIDLKTGTTLWKYVANAPIRIAPTVFEGKVLFGSDDGSVIALGEGNGELLWKTKVAPDAEHFLNDGRSISFMPVRTGVLVDPNKGHAIVSAGMFPWRSTYLTGLNIKTGEVVWNRDLGEGWTIEGALLMSPEHLIAPQGRAAPQLFAREDGESIGSLPGGGGSFVILTEDDQVMHGPGNKGGWITASDANSRAQIASFDKGTAVVVRDKVAYLLDFNKLSAFDRDTGKIHWSTKCKAPHELILAGGTLFAGGDDIVIAIDAESGKPLWSGDVNGRAFGLAVADGHLLVSTDEGSVQAFTASGEAAVPPKLESIEQAPLPQTPSPQVEVVDDEDLLYRWVFQVDQIKPVFQRRLDGPQQVIGLGTRRLPVPMPADLHFEAVGKEHAWVLGGSADAQIAADFKQANPPEKELTATAWVRIDKGQDWGGLLSMTQDNGGFEKGWILGFRGDKFGFAVNGKEGPDKLTWIVGQEAPFATGSWHHIAATYDGSTIKLYVDGKLAAESDEQQGSIDYPPEAAFQLGSYKDQDEHYLTHGMLNEVRLYNRTLTVDEIAQQFEAKSANFPEQQKLVVEEPRTIAPWRGPIMKFVKPSVATIKWWTPEPQPTQLELLREGVIVKTLGQATPTTVHEVTIEGIRRDELLEYQIQHVVDGEPASSPKYECDGHFDYLRTELPEGNLSDELLSQARQVLSATNFREPRGLAVVVGAADEGQFAEALCRVGGLDVIVVEKDEAVAKVARERLLKAGVYGRPVSIRTPDPKTGYGLPTRFADVLVVANLGMGERIPAADVSTYLRWLHPKASAVLPPETLSANDEDSLAAGKLEIISERNWQVFTAAGADGAAGWTHMYANPDNSAYAGETLSGVRSQSDLQVQWAGRPGPRYQSDRGNRKPAPLAADGHLYMQGLNRVIAVNAYNGTILWSWEFPEVVRFNVPRDSSNWCADERSVYIAAHDRCMVIDGATGELTAEYDVYENTNRSLVWGYVARYGDLLLGSGVQQDAPFRDFWGGQFWYDEKDGEHAKKVCSDVFFARDAKSGGLKWSYAEGLVVNPTVTISNGRVHFLECRSQALIDGETRRLDGDEFWNNLHLVTLDAESGKKMWERPVSLLPGISAMYQAAADGQIVLSTSKDGAFGVYCYDANTGEDLWSQEYPWETNHHGKHLSRPAIVQGKIYLRPYTLAAKDGEVLSKTFPDGHQCGTYTASRDALFLRAGSLAVWDRVSGDSSRWQRARPDCWISTIPAEGMLLSPEGGGGCSCGGWIETSMGFIPISLK